MAAAANEFEVVREATMPAPRATVFALLADFHRWAEWSPWEDIDPNMQRTYSGCASGSAPSTSGTGTARPGQGAWRSRPPTHRARLQLALQFLKPFKSSNTTTFELDEHDGGPT